jgi:hypothetical protein
VDDYFREAGDDWVLRQPLQQRLDVFARDNEEALIKANPINRDHDKPIRIEKRFKHFIESEEF